MQTKISALLELQSIERQLTHVKRRRGMRQRAITAQQNRIEQLQTDYDATHERSLSRRKDADRLELDLREREDKVAKQRGALNTAKTNKEYAAILTQINTLRADNSRIEEQTLTILQEVDSINTQLTAIKEQVQQEQNRLADIQKAGSEEIDRLDAMFEELSGKRELAAANVAAEDLSLFDRLAASHDGEAMAPIEIHGSKPPHKYVCGGCFMSLSAEHTNSLRTRDEIRTCGNCGRILHLETKSETSPTN